MEPVRVFSGNERDAGAVQYLLNSHLIGTWVRQARINEDANDEDAMAAVEIYIEAEHEAKARFVIANEKQIIDAQNTAI